MTQDTARPVGTGFRADAPSPDGLGRSGFNPSRDDMVELADAIVRAWECSPYQFPVTHEHQLQMAVIASRFLVELASDSDEHPEGGKEAPRPAHLLTHAFTPHPDYPWFCDECGYAEHETLKHPPRDSDTRRMAETGTGSVRSTGSAGRNGIAPTQDGDPS